MGDPLGGFVLSLDSGESSAPGRAHHKDAWQSEPQPSRHGNCRRPAYLSANRAGSSPLVLRTGKLHAEAEIMSELAHAPQSCDHGRAWQVPHVRRTIPRRHTTVQALPGFRVCNRLSWSASTRASCVGASHTNPRQTYAVARPPSALRWARSAVLSSSGRPDTRTRVGR